MQPAPTARPASSCASLGAVLRLSEADAAELVNDEPPEDETMIINMGPQHPSTHGVLRLMLELKGETVLRTKPIIGYLHTGMEKTGEELTYLQGATNVTRMDYAVAALQRAGVLPGRRAAARGRGPPRATWIRMLVSELNRIASHLTCSPPTAWTWRHHDDDLRLARARQDPHASSRSSPACA
jgi:NADH-quinone oxidoreductase subunit D